MWYLSKIFKFLVSYFSKLSLINKIFKYSLFNKKQVLLFLFNGKESYDLKLEIPLCEGRPGWLPSLYPLCSWRSLNTAQHSGCRPSPWRALQGSHASSFHSVRWPTNEGPPLEQTQGCARYSLESKHRIKASVRKGVWRKWEERCSDSWPLNNTALNCILSIYTWPFCSNKYYSTTWVVLFDPKATEQEIHSNIPRGWL